MTILPEWLMIQLEGMAIGYAAVASGALQWWTGKFRWILFVRRHGKDNLWFDYGKAVCLGCGLEYEPLTRQPKQSSNASLLSGILDRAARRIRLRRKERRFQLYES